MLHLLPSIIAPRGISDNYDHVSLNSLATCWMTSTRNVSSCFLLSFRPEIDADPIFDLYCAWMEVFFFTSNRNKEILENLKISWLYAY